jgi:CRP/FNR family cyclic AMP-dependent transcriptional regulator
MVDSSKESNFDNLVTHKEGSVIFVEGEPSTYLYIVKTGAIRIVKEDKDRIIPISLVRQKDFLGELSMFSDGPRSASAIADKDTEVMVIKKKDIKKVIKECPAWVSQIMETLCNRLINSVDMLREHRIVDDELSIGNEIQPQEEVNIKRALDDYRSRRNIGSKKKGKKK